MEVMGNPHYAGGDPSRQLMSEKWGLFPRCTPSQLLHFLVIEEFLLMPRSTIGMSRVLWVHG